MERAFEVQETLPVHEMVMKLSPHGQSFEIWQAVRNKGSTGAATAGFAGEISTGAGAAKRAELRTNNVPNRTSAFFMLSPLSRSGGEDSTGLFLIFFLSW
jgi:hypothetical protein